MSGRGGGRVLKVLAAGFILPFLLLTVGLVSCTGVTTASLRQSGCYGDVGSSSTGTVAAVDGSTGVDVVGWDESMAMAAFDGAQGPDNVCAPYAFGQCTWWTCMRQHMLGHATGSYWGNGNQWDTSAEAAGWKRGEAVAGGIIVYEAGVLGSDPTYGHVGVIERVDTAKGVVITSEKGAGYRVWSETRPLDPPDGVTYLAPPDGEPVDTGADEDAVTAVAASCEATGGDDGTVVDASYDGDGTHATPEQARAIARQLIPQYFPGEDEEEQFSCLVELWNGESGWRWDAENPSSGAYGIPQALPASKLASAGSDWKDNAGTQIKWGLQYIKGRADYGTPCKAWDMWNSRSPHWY